MLDLSRLQNLGEALADATVMHQSHVALIEADRHRESARYTYGEFRRASERFGATLQDRGLQPGDRVAIIMSNQAKWLISATGALWAGATLVPLDYKLTPSEQVELLAHSEAHVLVTEAGMFRKLDEARGASPWPVGRVVVTEAPEDAQLGTAERWEHVVSTPMMHVSRKRDDIACIVYSSGTSGTPKGCMLSHGNYLEQAQILGQLFPITRDDRYFSILPTNHAIDFMVGFVVPLLFGAAVVHQRTLRPQFLQPTMKRYGVTHMALVPTILRNLETKIRDALAELPQWQQNVIDGLMRINELATARRPNHALSRRLLAPILARFGGHLKLMFAGGALVDRQSAEFFYRIGIPVVIGYGLTEASTVVTVNDLKPFRGDTVGKPVPGVEVEIRDANSEGVGEVWVCGPTVMKGYFKAPELTADTIVDGWLRTGDLGKLDASGHLKLLGRAKNMIVTAGGKNVYPEDIEPHFEQLVGCEEVCVFASNYVWPGDLAKESLVIVLRGQDHASREDLVAELAKANLKLPAHKRVSGYVWWSTAFPRTASQKTKRFELARALRSKARDEQVVAL